VTKQPQKVDETSKVNRTHERQDKDEEINKRCPAKMFGVSERKG
jgi:hypothetical protein